MKTPLLVSAVLLVCACAAPLYQPPPDSTTVVNVQFDGLDYRTPLDEISIIDHQTCKRLKRVVPIKTAEGMSASFAQGQSVSVMVAFHGLSRSAYGNAPWVCKDSFTFTPESGKQYRVQAKAPRSFWKLTDDEAKTGRIPNRLPNSSICETDFMERTGHKDPWKHSARETICVDAL
jgi:hypothetical protein